MVDHDHEAIRQIDSIFGWLIPIVLGSMFVGLISLFVQPTIFNAPYYFGAILILLLASYGLNTSSLTAEPYRQKVGELLDVSLYKSLRTWKKIPEVKSEEEKLRLFLVEQKQLLRAKERNVHEVVTQTNALKNQLLKIRRQKSEAEQLIASFNAELKQEDQLVSRDQKGRRGQLLLAQNRLITLGESEAEMEEVVRGFERRIDRYQEMLIGLQGEIERCELQFSTSQALGEAHEALSLLDEGLDVQTSLVRFSDFQRQFLMGVARLDTIFDYDEPQTEDPLLGIAPRQIPSGKPQGSQFLTSNAQIPLEGPVEEVKSSSETRWRKRIGS